MLTISRNKSMAAAARELGVVPSALSYRVRQLEESLDVLLFDRNSRFASLTPAGKELLWHSERLLQNMQQVVQRVKRVASGWESEITIAVENIISRSAMLDMVQSFYAINSPTNIRIKTEVMRGTWETLLAGNADIAIGSVVNEDMDKNIASRPLGSAEFVFAVSPSHPLARAPEPISEDVIKHFRAVVVADTSTTGKALTIGVLPDQPRLTVPNMNSKIEAQLRGLGCGYLNAQQIQEHILAGRLVVKQLQQAARVQKLHYAWHRPERGKIGLALKWWITALGNELTQQALLNHQAGF